MDFLSALALLQDRKFVARPSWIEEKRFLAILPDFLNIMQLTGGEKANVSMWPPKIEDFNATDWVQV